MVDVHTWREERGIFVGHLGTCFPDLVVLAGGAKLLKLLQILRLR